MTEAELYKKEEIAKFINKLDLPFKYNYTVKLGKQGCYYLVEELKKAGYIT